MGYFLAGLKLQYVVILHIFLKVMVVNHSNYIYPKAPQDLVLPDHFTACAAILLRVCV